LSAARTNRNALIERTDSTPRTQSDAWSGITVSWVCARAGIPLTVHRLLRIFTQELQNLIVSL
jgi:hypothetical protein